VSAVSTHETDRVGRGGEDFWLIVAAGLVFCKERSPAPQYSPPRQKKRRTRQGKGAHIGSRILRRIVLFAAGGGPIRLRTFNNVGSGVATTRGRQLKERVVLAVTAVAILGAAIAMPARSTRAEPAATDCLTEPTGAAPPGSHWYYRTDRSTGTRCWHLKPRRDKGQEELAVGTPRPSSGPIAEPKVEPPARAGVAEPVAEVPTLQSVWAAAAPIAAASSIEQGAAEQSQMQPPHEQERQADEPSATAVLSVAALPADAISNTRLVTLALVAAVVALAAVIALKVFQLLFVRWLQRRRSALRRQGRAASVASAPEPSFLDRSAHIAQVEENLRLLLRDLEARGRARAGSGRAATA